MVFFGLTFLLYYFELNYLKDYSYPDIFFKGSTDDAKSVITTLLSAMITMATLAISITIVVLSLAASQLGPRLIKSFMKDARTKDFIGLFFGTVMSCFVLMVMLHSSSSEIQTPEITVSSVIMLCSINLFVLLGFTHHVARSCIADHVILNVSKDFNQALKRLTSENEMRVKGADRQRKSWPDDFSEKAKHIYFERAGYVQNINYNGLVDIAKNNDLFVNVDFKSGHFFVKGEDGIAIYSDKDIDEDIITDVRGCFIIGDARTPTQDIEYSIRHLVEIAVRALSPGINDCFTAMHVLDHLSAGMAVLFDRAIQMENGYDDQGVQRLKARQSHEDDVIFGAFEQIRFNGRKMPSILTHMLEKIVVLADLAKTEDAKHGLLEQLNGICYDLERIDDYMQDKQKLITRTKKLISELK